MALVNSTKQSKETWAKTEDRHSLVQSYFTTSGQEKDGSIVSTLSAYGAPDPDPARGPVGGLWMTKPDINYLK